MELTVEKQLVASGEFEIVDREIPGSGPFNVLRSGLKWANAPLDLEAETALLALSGLADADQELASTVSGLSWVRSGPAGDGLRALQTLEVLARADAGLAKKVVEFPWMADDVTMDEGMALQSLTLWTGRNAGLAARIAGLEWVQRGISEDERRTLSNLWDISIEHPSLIEVLLDMPWLADRLTKDEARVITDLRWLARGNSGFAALLVSLRWLADSITDVEQSAVADLAAAGVNTPSLFQSLLSLPWLRDGVKQQEARVTGNLRLLGENNHSVAEQAAQMRILDGPIETTQQDLSWGLWKLSEIDPSLVLDLSAKRWFADGLNEDEAELVWSIASIASRSPEAAKAIIRMPFLETFEPADALATKSLQRVVFQKDDDDEESDVASEQFQRLMEYHSIKDGITDEETRIVAAINCASENNPDLLDVLLSPGGPSFEERTIILPLSGDVKLTIVRTRPGSQHTMDLLEAAVLWLEEFTGYPLPTGEVVYLFEEATRSSFGGPFGGTHCGSHIVSLPEYDEDSKSRRARLQLLAHELAHYYWTDFKQWVNEGAANFLSAISVNAGEGWPINPEEVPCTHYRSIAELDEDDPKPTTQEFNCNYSLGERLFHDLYRNLDDTAFRLALRSLYLLSQADATGDECEGTKLDICHVRAAFTTGMSPETAQASRQVIDRWYDGGDLSELKFRDDSPVNPEMPWVGGRITRSFLSTTGGAFPVSAVQGVDENHPALCQSRIFLREWRKPRHATVGNCRVFRRRRLHLPPLERGIAGSRHP